MSRQAKLKPNELKEWRKHLGFTQKDAAKHFRVPLRTYQGWELGRRKTHVTLIRMAMRQAKKKEAASTVEQPKLL